MKTTVKHFNNGWRVLVTIDGETTQHGIGSYYNMAQAQIYSDSIRRDYARHGILPN